MTDSPAGTVASEPARDASAMRFIVFTIFIDSIGFGIVLPVVPGLVMSLGHVRLDAATAIGGYLAVLYAISGFLFGPVMGNLGDRFGRRPVLLAALGGLGLDYLLMAAAPSLGWLFLGRAVAGALGASWVPGYAAIADISAPADRARRFGMLSAAFGIGFIVGPALGGLLGTVGPRAPFWLAAALSCANLCYGLIRFPETLPAERRRAFHWRRANPLGALLSLRRLSGVLPVALVLFLWNVASIVYPATWSFYAIAAFGWSTGMIGLSLMWTGLLMAAIQARLLGGIVARLGERRAALLGLAAGGFGFLCYAFIRTGWLMFPVMLLAAFQCLVMPSLSAMMSARVGADQQGELQGFSGSLNALGAIVAPLLLNPALAHFTRPGADPYFPGAAFMISTAVVAVAMIGLVLAPRRPLIDMEAKA